MYFLFCFLFIKIPRPSNLKFSVLISPKNSISVVFSLSHFNFFSLKNSIFGYFENNILNSNGYNNDNCFKNGFEFNVFFSELKLDNVFLINSSF